MTSKISTKMSGSILTALLFVSALSLAPVDSVKAWGVDGHRIVCAIAMDKLSAPVREKVRTLAKSYTTPDGKKYSSYPWSCVFADDARKNARNGEPGWEYFERFENWHFLNVPRETVEVQLRHCAWNCVIRGIEYHFGRLEDGSLADWKRAEAMFFLGHWVGDLHQPLHISFADDRGGNEIELAQGSKYKYSNPGWKSHLHGVWDSRIIQFERGDRTWQEYADDLSGADFNVAGPFEASEYRKWAQESYEITVSPDVEYCHWFDGGRGDEKWCRRNRSELLLDDAYQEMFAPVVEKRLQLAGARLAALISAALDL